MHRSLAVNDLKNINRQFLIFVRSIAVDPSAPLLTGMPLPVLAKIATMSLDQIDSLAANASVSFIRLRVTEKDIDRMVSMSHEQCAAYSLAMAAVRTVN